MLDIEVSGSRVRKKKQGFMKFDTRFRPLEITVMSVSCHLFSDFCFLTPETFIMF